MLTLDNKKYSREAFDGYTHSATVRLEKWNHNDPFTVYLYTTDSDVNSVENVLLDRRHTDVTSIQILSFTTYEQDVLRSQFIDEILDSF